MAQGTNVSPLRLGLIGLDTSHVEALAAACNDPASPHAVANARIVVGYPGGSPDFPLSIERLPRFTQRLRDHYGVQLVDSPQAVAEAVDAVLVTSVDGRRHREQIEAIAPLRRPTFLDKPFATTTADARAIVAAARRHGMPLCSSSSLRFASALQAVRQDVAGGRILGADFAGPMPLQDTQPGYFWYGIHTVEMVYAAMGSGCVAVRAVATPTHEIAVGRWADGRLGVARGNRAGVEAFTGVVHRERAPQWVEASQGVPPQVNLLHAILAFFRGGPTPVPLEETLELVRFLEAANESRAADGREVLL